MISHDAPTRDDGLTAAAPDPLPARLHCAGGQLVKPNGQVLRLRGVSFGSWGEDDPADAVQIRAIGANVVRVALRWWGRHGSKPGDVDARDNDGFALLKRSHVAHWLDMISACAAEGLWTVPFIDSNCIQSGTQDADTRLYCDPYGSWGAAGRNALTDPAMRKIFAEVVWPAAAARLRAVDKVAMLELQPEMMDGRGPEVAAAVRDFYRQVIAGIRSVDADTPVLVGARDGYRIEHAAEAYLSERSDVVYTGNLLNQYVTDADKFDSGLAALLQLRADKGVPVWGQQVGRKTGSDRNLQHMARALDRLDEEDVGYAWWQWKQNTSAPDEYALNYKTQDGRGWIQKSDEVALLATAWE
jgi:hypothetical protein